MKNLLLAFIISTLSASSFAYTLSQSCGKGKGVVMVRLAAGYDPVANLQAQVQYLNDIFEDA